MSNFIDSVTDCLIFCMSGWIMYLSSLTFLSCEFSIPLLLVYIGIYWIGFLSMVEIIRNYKIEGENI
jgi:hypothetical protein